MNSLASYDQVPYTGHPIPTGHPERMATLGGLFGLDPAPVAGCRVLEMGCADGGHLIPMALHLPGSEFVGLDLSRRQIEMGQNMLREFGCANVRLEHAGIMDVDPNWGVFDYIICHGVYSWVPAEVQERILAVCAENLADRGLAFVSYNTYPGWYGPEMVRNLMQYHTSGLTDPVECVQQALAVTDFVARFIQTEDDEYARWMQKELERVKNLSANMGSHAYIYHEYLEDRNSPVYFHQFAARAAAHGLQYLGEAVYANMLTHGFPDPVGEVLDGIGGDVVALEQYMDFLRNRRFRQTLLCRAGLALDRDPPPDRVVRLMAVCTRNVTPEFIDLAPVGPLAKAALRTLLEARPRAVPFEDLHAAALSAEPSGHDDPSARERLARDLIRLYRLNMIQLRSWQAGFVTRAGERPRIGPMALYQARKGQPWLANEVHEAAYLTPVLVHLASLLDGTLDRNGLIEHLRAQQRAGYLTLAADAQDPDVKTPEPSEEDWRRILDQMLAALAEKALLIA
ncbi:MAG: methyltransferase regulatory domain-containing protein [Proteobacteria bacterium]|nr:methyltransferase regulatory domain-containing protein [Pseudomonadota bacterium]